MGPLPPLYRTVEWIKWVPLNNKWCDDHWTISLGSCYFYAGIIKPNIWVIWTRLHNVSMFIVRVFGFCHSPVDMHAYNKCGNARKLTGELQKTNFSKTWRCTESLNMRWRSGRIVELEWIEPLIGRGYRWSWRIYFSFNREVGVMERIIKWLTISKFSIRRDKLSDWSSQGVMTAHHDKVKSGHCGLQRMSNYQYGPV